MGLRVKLLEELIKDHHFAADSDQVVAVERLLVILDGLEKVGMVANLFELKTEGECESGAKQTTCIARFMYVLLLESLLKTALCCNMSMYIFR